MIRLTQAIKSLIMEVAEPVISGVAAKWEGCSISGWKIKAYKVGTYFRVDIFPPTHGTKHRESSDVPFSGQHRIDG